MMRRLASAVLMPSSISCLVLVQVGADPDAQRHRHAVAARDLRHLVHAAVHRVGADMAGELRQLRQVAVDLLGRDVLVLSLR